MFILIFLLIFSERKMNKSQQRWRSSKKYKSDVVFQKIESNFLTLSDEERKDNNKYLDAVIHETLLPKLKEDDLFNLMFQKIVYGGSYYKGTKYGKPDEFDLDFVMRLPINYDQIIVDTKHENCGFVKLKLQSRDITNNEKWLKHRDTLDNWITDDNYLSQRRFRKWMRTVLSSVFNKFERIENGFIIRTKGHSGILSEKTYTITHKESGPAFTISINVDDKIIDVDIVPCLEFEIYSLSNGYRSLHGGKKNVMFIPKSLQRCIPENKVLWRLCFYQQEKDILKGEVKPIIKMMKKLRDKMRWDNLASYYIETIFYHALDSNKPNLRYFLQHSKTSLFMYGLNMLRDHLRNEYLSYFWHDQYNLFDRLEKLQLRYYADQLESIINKIDRYIGNKEIILIDHILNKQESENFWKKELENKLHVERKNNEAMQETERIQSGVRSNNEGREQEAESLESKRAKPNDEDSESEENRSNDESTESEEDRPNNESLELEKERSNDRVRKRKAESLVPEEDRPNDESLVPEEDRPNDESLVLEEDRSNDESLESDEDNSNDESLESDEDNSNDEVEEQNAEPKRSGISLKKIILGALPFIIHLTTPVCNDTGNDTLQLVKPDMNFPPSDFSHHRMKSNHDSDQKGGRSKTIRTIKTKDDRSEIIRTIEKNYNRSQNLRTLEMASSSND